MKFRHQLVIVCAVAHLAAFAEMPCNYIETITPLLGDEGDINEVRVDRQYYDGIGRPTLSVMYNGNALQAGVATYQTYNLGGLPEQNWLPVPVATDNEPLSKGDFRSIAGNFYSAEEIPFEASYYHRYGAPKIVSKTGPGKDWAGHPKNYSYFGNDTDDVMLITVDGDNVSAQFYSPNTLHAVKVTDEDGNSTVTFTDLEDRTVMVRQLPKGAATGLETYYVYDIYGDLRAIVPPAAASMLRSSKPHTLGKYYADAYIFRYKYDIDHRPVVIKEPGADAVYCVYDRFGNLAMRQDGRQRAAGEWTVRKVDALMRPVAEGIVQTTLGHDHWLGVCDNEYFIEQRDNDSESNLFYTNTSGPAGFEPYIAWLYDDYDFLTAESLPDIPAGQGFDANFIATGLQTATAMKADTPSGVLIRATVYDKEQRPVVECDLDCFGNGYRHTVFHSYTHTGEEKLRIERLEERAELTTVSLREMALRYTHDERGRITRTEWRKSSTAEWEDLTTNTYDAIGRLATEQNALAATSYGYNVRGSLTSISSPLFTQALHYGSNPLGGAANYAGKICASSEHFGAQQAATALNWKYTYDGYGRLTSAEDAGGKMSEGFIYDDNTNITKLRRSYDGITVQEAHYWLDGNHIEYIEDGGTNILAGIVPSVAESAPVYDANGCVTADPARGISGVAYNKFANLPAQVTFNDGNTVRFKYLPDGSCREIAETERQLKVTVRVNANGDTVRTERVVTNTTARSYYGAFERIGTAWRYHTPAGHYDYNDSTHYFYARDYLGSTRAVYAAEPSGYRTTQQVRYYPSGVPVELSTATPTTDRLHHGKQWINRNGFGHYFNSARLHDALTARFDNPDPLASSNPGVSPYAHCNGDPVNNIDPDGNAANFIAALVGAGAGAIVGSGVEAVSQIWHNGGITDWKAVGGAAANGAINGAVAGLTMGASLVASAATAAAGNVVAGAVERSINNQSTTVKDAIGDAVTGGMAAGLGAAVGKTTEAALNRMSNQAKGKLGEAITQVKYAARGYKVADHPFSIETGQLTPVTGKPAVAKFDYLFKNIITGKEIVRDSKFNTAHFTRNQQIVSDMVKQKGSIQVGNRIITDIKTDNTTSTQIGNLLKSIVSGSSVIISQ